MDSILALILIFWIVSAFSKALKPKKKAGEAGRKRADARVDRENPAPAQPAPAEQPPAAQPTFMMPPLQPRSAHSGSLEGASTEGRDTCDPTLGHDRRKAAPYTGSLGSVSTEGRDTCDPTLGHDRRTAARRDEPRAVPAERRENSPHRRAPAADGDAYALDEGIMPQLDAQALIQGVVMSEILKRPNERKWGWR